MKQLEAVNIEQLLVVFVIQITAVALPRNFGMDVKQG